MGERMMGRDLLESRIDDAIAKAERGSVARLSFLNLRCNNGKSFTLFTSSCSFDRSI